MFLPYLCFKFIDFFRFVSVQHDGLLEASSAREIRTLNALAQPTKSISTITKNSVSPLETMPCGNLDCGIAYFFSLEFPRVRLPYVFLRVLFFLPHFRDELQLSQTLPPPFPVSCLWKVLKNSPLTLHPPPVHLKQTFSQLLISQVFSEAVVEKNLQNIVEITLKWGRTKNVIRGWLYNSRSNLDCRNRWNYRAVSRYTFINWALTTLHGSIVFIRGGGARKPHLKLNRRFEQRSHEEGFQWIFFRIWEGV